jgi:hypothetical protein
MIAILQIAIYKNGQINAIWKMAIYKKAKLIQFSKLHFLKTAKMQKTTNFALKACSPFRNLHNIDS